MARMKVDLSKWTPEQLEEVFQEGVEGVEQLGNGGATYGWI